MHYAVTRVSQFRAKIVSDDFLTPFIFFLNPVTYHLSPILAFRHDPFHPSKEGNVIKASQLCLSPFDYYTHYAVTRMSEFRAKIVSDDFFTPFIFFLNPST